MSSTKRAHPDDSGSLLTAPQEPSYAEQIGLKKAIECLGLYLPTVEACQLLRTSKMFRDMSFAHVHALDNSSDHAFDLIAERSRNPRRDVAALMGRPNSLQEVRMQPQLPWSPAFCSAVVHGVASRASTLVRVHVAMHHPQLYPLPGELVHRSDAAATAYGVPDTRPVANFPVCLELSLDVVALGAFSRCTFPFATQCSLVPMPVPWPWSAHSGECVMRDCEPRELTRLRGVLRTMAPRLERCFSQELALYPLPPPPTPPPEAEGGTASGGGDAAAGGQSSELALREVTMGVVKVGGGVCVLNSVHLPPSVTDLRLTIASRERDTLDETTETLAALRRLLDDHPALTVHGGPLFLQENTGILPLIQAHGAGLPYTPSTGRLRLTCQDVRVPPVTAPSAAGVASALTHLFGPQSHAVARLAQGDAEGFEGAWPPGWPGDLTDKPSKLHMLPHEQQPTPIPGPLRLQPPIELPGVTLLQETVRPGLSATGTPVCMHMLPAGSVLQGLREYVSERQLSGGGCTMHVCVFMARAGVHSAVDACDEAFFAALQPPATAGVGQMHIKHSLLELSTFSSDGASALLQANARVVRHAIHLTVSSNTHTGEVMTALQFRAALFQRLVSLQFEYVSHFDVSATADFAAAVPTLRRLVLARGQEGWAKKLRQVLAEKGRADVVVH